MDALKTKRAMALFGSLTAMRLTCVAAGIVGIVAVLCALGCEQKAGLAPPPGGARAGGPGQATPVLTNAMCVVCHPQQVETIRDHGAQHKTEVTCLDCHREHPPQGENAIPQCSMCHSGKPHFELKDCSSCHTNAHAPLDITFEGDVTAACLTCHEVQGVELKEHPSAHTDMPCTECHTSHRQIPSCMDCHEKHTPDMDFQACVSCHPAHMPLVITYGPQTPNRWCAACHREAYDQLSKSKSKHHDLTCVVCHKDRHKFTPACTVCHPEPHTKAMLEKFPHCSQCHGTAHDLRG
jgi:hypothetical protein